jgi:chromosomal replication initiator protein
MLTVAVINSSKHYVRDCNWNGFLVLPENRSGVRAMRKLVGATLSWKRSSFGPLVLHGPSGTGKTLLTSAALKTITRSIGGFTVQKVAAGDLSRSGGDEDFADEDLQTCDFLIVEDIQHLSTRASDAACELIDHRTSRGKPLVISASTGPAGLTHLPRRLTSRLAAGLVVQLNHLGMRSRRAILRTAARQCKTRLAPDALQWLSEQGTGMRAALGLLQNISPFAARYSGPLDRKAVEHLLADSGQPTSTRGDPEQIVKRVAAVFGLSEKELLGASRLRSVLLPRQVAMYLMRELTKLSLPRIGAFFAGRDHTTVLHACRKVEAEMVEDEKLVGIVRQIRRELN